MDDRDLFNRLLILRSPNIGPVKYAQLISKYGGPEQVVDVLQPKETIRDAVSRELEIAHKLNIHYICDDNVEYPALLRTVTPHPPVLTVRGNIDTLKKTTISIVGTRHATAAGLSFVANVAKVLAEHGHVVVSGMAIGTDTAAHRGALRVDGNSQTIAVLAGGVDYIWPLENENLYWEIVERGAVISEMPVGFTPVASNFVMRNRWVAGISNNLILSEADFKSGSMKTVQFARESNRNIWAIPSHPSDPRSVGPNSLIKSGAAKLFDSVSDFLGSKKIESENVKNEKKSDSENYLLDALGTIPVSESVLSEIVKKTISEIKSELVVLELQGLVRKVDGGYIRS